MNKIQNSIVYVKKEFFIDHTLKEILYFDDKNDESNRAYLCLAIKYKNNNIFVPLRSEIIPYPNFGIIGFSVPSKKRPKAGLDYRKLLIINDLNYIEIPSIIKIPNAQQNLINKDISTITAQVIDYIKGYEVSFSKGRTQRDKKYRFSSLCNYHNELNLV